MKIGILTFHASHNYGSMLQAYALQYYLNTHGYDAETINLRIDAQQDLYHFPLRPIQGKWRQYAISLLNPLWMFHSCRKWFKYEDFLKDNLKLTSKIYKNWEEIQNDLHLLGYQSIITGGDQIWNMNCRDFDKSFYLPSKLSGIRKISYSPSFGGKFLSRMTSEQESFIKGCLIDYDFISVRETSMQKYLIQLLDRDIDIAEDPTMLLHLKDYERFVGDTPIVKGDYIFYYTPFVRPKIEQLVLKIGKYYGLKVVTAFPHICHRKGLQSVNEVGPAEFLNILSNAKMVIGKSFHLVIFSLMFHKDFIAIDGDKDARIKSLLEIMNIPERGMLDEMNYQSLELPKIDFGRIDSVIENMRLHSEKFLMKALT